MQKEILEDMPTHQRQRTGERSYVTRRSHEPKAADAKMAEAGVGESASSSLLGSMRTAGTTGA